MKVFRESGILVISVLISAKGFYVTAFTIVQETFACKLETWSICASFLRQFSIVQWLVRCTLSLYETVGRHIN